MNSLIRNAWLLVMIAMLLTACGSGPSGPHIKPINDKSRTMGLALYEQQEYLAATDHLMQAWSRNKNDLDVYVALLDSWKQMGEMTQIWNLLSNSQLQSSEISVIETELAIEEGRCGAFQGVIPNVNSSELNTSWQQRYWQAQAQCLQLNKKYLAAVEALVQLGRLADDDLMNQVWHNEIVNHLIRVREDELIMAIGDSKYDQETQGWFEAAYVNFGADGISGMDWNLQWPNHPASQYFLDMNQVNTHQKVAVLLPLSGRFKSAAKAVQQGLLTASVADEMNQYELQFYDTGSQAENFSTAWYAAQENGVDMIIGPLDRESINAVELMPAPAIPVVLLNQSDSEHFQFTLSPEGEAEQVAERMFEAGERRVVIMAPNEPWGERMTQAFAQRFVDLGGQITDNSYFQKTANDYSAQLRKTLGVIESQLRAKNLQGFLKVKLSSEEVVRSDMDAIFLAARPEFARLMVPQLKFHHAGDVPVYTSSHVFDGLNNEQHNRDLQGVQFAISPMQLQSSQLAEILPFDIKRVKSSKNLFALGYDAYQLITRLQWMSRINTGVVDGLTGKISLNFDGQFVRGLQWAQYNNGSIVALPQ